MPRTLVTVATYNEIGNLPTLVEELFRAAPDVDLLVIDDASPDGTGRWVDERASHDQRVHGLHRSGKLGLGSAILAGLRYAIDHNYDFVLHMDGDLSHPPHFVPALLQAIEKHDPPLDVVIGSRYVPGGQIENWPRSRRWMSRLVNAYCRLLLRLPVHDYSGGFRCYRVACLRRMDLDAIAVQGYAVLEELLWHLHHAGAVMGEVPITFVDRRHGSSKISSKEAWGVLTTVLRLGLRRGKP